MCIENLSVEQELIRKYHNGTLTFFARINKHKQVSLCSEYDTCLDLILEY